MTEPDRVFLQMWGPTREHLIANHQFCVAQARTRLLDQFVDDAMKADAQRHSDEWLAERAHYFDPERDDPGANYEAAYDEHISFYLSLAGLRDSTRLSIIAGMFHEWEKQVRDWLGRELGHLGLKEHVHAAVWAAKFDELMDLFEQCAWPVRDQEFYSQLQRAQLVVNVYNIVGDHRTGELYPLGLGGEGYDQLQLRFDNASDSLTARWGDIETQTCITQRYRWNGTDLVELAAKLTSPRVDFGCDELPT